MIIADESSVQREREQALQIVEWLIVYCTVYTDSHWIIFNYISGYCLFVMWYVKTQF